MDTLPTLPTASDVNADKKKRLATAKALMTYAGTPNKQEYVDGVAVQQSPWDALARLGAAAGGAYIAKKNQIDTPPSTAKGGKALPPVK